MFVVDAVDGYPPAWLVSVNMTLDRKKYMQYSESGRAKCPKLPQK